ncbi:MAG: RNase adapter RapZ [Gammaproteobacteria bacterium]|jgi:RNase adapter protein RapZ
MRLIIVTGLSGSGKSVALHALEDAGYYCIDNLPVSLLPALTSELLSNNAIYSQDVAIGIDVRTSTSGLDILPPVIEGLRQDGLECTILFLEAEDRVLLRRFSETRRRHPLSDREHTLTEAVLLERRKMLPVRQAADLLIDTSRTSLHQLRRQIRRKIARIPEELQIEVQSFGFKFGLPQDADLVFDARLLPNPYWRVELRPLTGKDREVREFLENEPETGKFIGEIEQLLHSWLPGYRNEGRSYLTIAIGCTGGQHRSVYLVEQLAERLREKGYNCLINHREFATSNA